MIHATGCLSLFHCHVWAKSIVGDLTQTWTNWAKITAYFSPTEHWFIIIHVHSVIRPGGGPWLADFELPSAHCSLLPAENLSSIPTRSHPASYSYGKRVIMAIWTLSVGNVCVCVCKWAVLPPTPALHQQPASASVMGGSYIGIELL